MSPIYRSQLLRNLESELVEMKSKAKNVLFSAEHFHSQLRSIDELEKLKALLPATEQVKIVLYIRRQDRAAFSLYSTALKAGSEQKGFNFPSVENKTVRYRFDYLQAYQLWSSVFGPESMVVRIFDRKEFVNGDLLQDFCFSVGIQWSDDYEVPAIKNPSMDANGELVFQYFNQLRKSAGDEYTQNEINHLKQVLLLRLQVNPGRNRHVWLPRSFLMNSCRQTKT